MNDGNKERHRQAPPHYASLVTFIEALGFEPDDARDLAEDVYARVLQNDYRSEAKWNYLQQVARRLAYNTIRDRANTRRTQHNISAIDQPDPPRPSPDSAAVPVRSSALAERLSRIKELGGLTGRDIAQLLDTTPETVSRWSTGRVDPQPERLQRLLELEFFLAELAELYSPEEAKLWLFSPHKLLGGETAAARIQAGKTQDVFALLDQLRSGAYL